MEFQKISTGAGITLTTKLGAGGEAAIYLVEQEPTLVAKIYHYPTADHGLKLSAMLANPPDDPMKSQGRISIAWPVDLVKPFNSPTVVGFLMPLVSKMHPLIDFYNPMTRLQRYPAFNYYYLHNMAFNLATAMAAVHARGYVIGDVNESNVLGDSRTYVTLVDTDSFQVTAQDAVVTLVNADSFQVTAQDIVYRCPVGKPEFTPQELQGKQFVDIDRTQEHDRFGLAVLIFQLLMEGMHPFAGKFSGNGEPPLIEERISQGHFPYSRGKTIPYKPVPMAVPFGILSPTVQNCFIRCFDKGHSNPKLRPDAQSWKLALQEARESLGRCKVNAQHRYGKHLAACPWCQRAAEFGFDAFPSSQATATSSRTCRTPTSVPRMHRPPTPTSIPQAYPVTSYKTYTSTPLPSALPTKSRNYWAWASLGVTVLALISQSLVWGIIGIILGCLSMHRAMELKGTGSGMGMLAIIVGTIMAVAGVVGEHKTTQRQSPRKISRATNSGWQPKQPDWMAEVRRVQQQELKKLAKEREAAWREQLAKILKEDAVRQADPEWKRYLTRRQQESVAAQSKNNTERNSRNNLDLPGQTGTDFPSTSASQLCTACQGKKVRRCPDCISGDLYEPCGVCAGKGVVDAESSFAKCSVCKGTGSKITSNCKNCEQCQGTGRLQDGRTGKHIKCPTCDGSGTIFKSLSAPCPDCQGKRGRQVYSQKDCQLCSGWGKTRVAQCSRCNRGVIPCTRCNGTGLAKNK